jgi:hypothetical protein
MSRLPKVTFMVFRFGLLAQLGVLSKEMAFKQDKKTDIKIK